MHVQQSAGMSREEAVKFAARNIAPGSLSSFLESLLNPAQLRNGWIDMVENSLRRARAARAT